MTRLNWDAVGERYYETGVDRGVLYVDGTGVSWPGLVSVSESPSGGEARPYYIDGFKYLNISSAEEFEATIEGFSSPAEFGPCDGVGQLYSGFYATQQPRKPFSFSYRTKVGNDIEGVDHAYKLHLVYNALAAPASRAYASLNESAEAPTLSWDITTLPPKITGFRPTAHFVVDSRNTPRGLMAAIEDILYGTDAVAPRIPTSIELLGMFQSEGPITRRNLFVNPSMRSMFGPTEARRNYALNPRQIADGYRDSGPFVYDTGYTAPWPMPTVIKMIPGGPWTHLGFGTIPTNAAARQCIVRFYGGTGTNTVAAYVLQNLSTNTPISDPYYEGTYYRNGVLMSQPINSNVAPAWHEYRFTVPANTPEFLIGVKDISGGAGAAITLTAVSVEAMAIAREFFDGSTPDADGYDYAWVGAVNASMSTAKVMNPTNVWSDGITRVVTIGAKKWAALARGGYIYANMQGGVVGKFYAARFTIAGPPGAAYVTQSTDNVVAGWVVDQTGIFPPSGEIEVALASTRAVAGATLFVGIGPSPTIQQQRITDVVVEEVSGIGILPGSFFDGSTPDANANYYRWEGAVDASVSKLNTWN